MSLRPPCLTVWPGSSCRRSPSSFRLRDASFDLALTTMSFHHWADQRTALGEVRRVLSSGGIFVLADLLAAGPARILLLRRGWGRFASPAVLDEMLRDAGFEVERLVRAPKVPGCVQVALARATGSSGS